MLRHFACVILVWARMSTSSVALLSDSVGKAYLAPRTFLHKAFCAPPSFGKRSPFGPGIRETDGDTDARTCGRLEAEMQMGAEEDFRKLTKNVLRIGDVRYFAFGSNLNPKVFKGMRRMNPLNTEAGCVKKYRLAFNLRGLPGVEPSFASAEPSAEPNDPSDGPPQPSLGLHGLIYTLRRSDWNRLAASEGVGAAYDLEVVSCVSYAGQQLQAVTLRTRKGPLRAASDIPPSRAYLDLMIEGAKQGGLSPEYIRYLEALPTSANSLSLLSPSRAYL